MTRKDYELIAGAFKSALEREGDNHERVIGISRACHTLAIDLEQENDRFDLRKFLKACGFLTFTD